MAVPRVTRGLLRRSAVRGAGSPRCRVMSRCPSSWGRRTSIRRWLDCMARCWAHGTIRSIPTSPAKGRPWLPRFAPNKAFKDPLLGIQPTDKLQLVGSGVPDLPRLGLQRSLLDQFNQARRDLESHERIPYLQPATAYGLFAAHVGKDARSTRLHARAPSLAAVSRGCFAGESRVDFAL